MRSMLTLLALQANMKPVSYPTSFSSQALCLYYFTSLGRHARHQILRHGPLCAFPPYPCLALDSTFTFLLL